MAWSTRELADLAGTTVNTVRYYHRVGLLDEPERRNNGYKEYGVRHLDCLLRIRRLVQLGVPISQIGRLRPGDTLDPEVLRQVDAELATEIERLQQTRTAIATILRDGAPADVPEGFESVASRLSQNDTSLLHVYTRLYDEDALKDLRHMVEADTDPVNKEIDDLPADADEETRRSLAERLAPVLAQNLVDYPWLTDPRAHVAQSAEVTRRTLIEAVAEVYNTAQLDVLRRASILAHEQLGLTEPNPSP